MNGIGIILQLIFGLVSILISKYMSIAICNANIAAAII
jgi:hypothetical protein